MNSPEPAVQPTSKRSPARRIATAVTLGALLFVALWITMFSMVTSLVIGTGCCVVLVAASSASDVVEMVLDAISAVVFGVVTIIGAIFAAIFGLFGF